MPFRQDEKAVVKVEGQESPWEPVTLAQMPPELQGVLDQDYKAIKSEFDRQLSQTVLTQEMMMGLCAVTVLGVLVICGSIVAYLIQAGGVISLWVLFAAALCLGLTAGAGYYEYATWKVQLISKRKRQYKSFVSEVNANFPQTRWELNEENGASDVSFRVFEAGAATQAAVPVVAAVVVGATTQRDNANYV